MKYIPLLVVAIILVSRAVVVMAVKVEHAVIKSDHVKIEQNGQNGQTVIFKGNVILNFRGYTLNTFLVKINYLFRNKALSIHYISIPQKVMVLEHSTGNIITANSAKYFATSRQLILTGDVTIKYMDSVIKTQEFTCITSLNY